MKRWASYRRGFQVAIEVVTRSGEEEEHEHRGEEGSAIKRFNTLNEIAWVVVIWYFILLIFGGIQTTPVDMWWWLVGVDWYGVYRAARRRVPPGLHRMTTAGQSPPSRRISVLRTSPASRPAIHVGGTL